MRGNINVIIEDQERPLVWVEKRLTSHNSVVRMAHPQRRWAVGLIAVMVLLELFAVVMVVDGVGQ